MPATLSYFMFPEDELQLFRFLEPRGLVVYPEISDPGEVPAPLGPTLQPTLEAPAYYLAMESAGPVVGRPVKRGPNKGRLEIDELASPVFHYERSLTNDQQELVGGRIWAELDVVHEVTGTSTRATGAASPRATGSGPRPLPRTSRGGSCCASRATRAGPTACGAEPPKTLI